MLAGTNEFRSRAKDEIAFIEKDNYNREIKHEEIEVVFMCYVMGNMKGIFVIPAANCGRCYEVSYSCNTDTMYIDEYHKTGTKIVAY